MPFQPDIVQRALREKMCKVCYVQLVVSGALSFAAVYELWRSPFPATRVGRALKYGVCVYSLLPMTNFFVESCVDPIFCDPEHGHLLWLRTRDVLCGVLYWTLRVLGELEGPEVVETGLEDVD